MKCRNFWTRLSGCFLAAVMTVSIPGNMLMVHAESDSAIVTDVSFSDASDIVSDVTLEDGALDPVLVDISVAAGNTIDEEAVGNESRAEVFSSTDSAHDWSAYVSDTLPDRLSAKEKTMYDACEAMLLTYLNHSNVDAVRYTTSSYSYYVTSSIDFASMGLTKNEAFAVAQMFLYNNPQYYFASSIFLTTPTNIWFTIYDSFADGDIRAGYTDSVFTQLDKWIVACSDYETTTYMKEVSVHEKICNTVDYISGTYDQSIYSALIQNKTVCAGYSEVFSMMLNAMDIDTMTVLSDCHAWNVVQLDDGNYYCVDATWNDSLGGRYLFNVSEDGLKKYDTASNEHQVSVYWSDAWVPDISSRDYVPTYYDTTGFEGEGSVALSAPDNLSGTYDKTADTIRVDWTDVAGASGYEVEVYDNDTGAFVGGSRIVVNHIRVSLVSGRNMLVKIRAVGNNEGVACYSEWSQITYIDGRFAAYREDGDVELSPPGNFKAVSSDNGMFDLSWSRVSNASGYSVLLYSDPDRQDKLASLTTTALGVHVTGISKDTPVYAYIRAFKSISGVTYYSEWSVLTVRSTADMTKPLGKPSDLNYAQSSGTSGRISWVPGKNSVFTKVVIKLGSITGKSVGSLTTSAAAVNLTGLNGTKTYYVGLQAVSKDGTTSDWVYTKLGHSTSGGSASESTGKEDDTVMVPSSLSYEDYNGISGRLTWTQVDHASSYQVQISSRSDFGKLVGELTMGGTAVKINGIKQGTAYYARVRAVGKTGMLSSWKTLRLTSSSVSGGETADTKISAPTGLAVFVVNDRNRISWNRVEQAAKYTVEIYSDSSYQTRIANMTMAGTSVLVNGMVSGRTYYVRVNAVSSDGKISSWTSYQYTR